MGEGMGTGKICEPVSGVRCIEVCVYIGKGHLPMWTWEGSQRKCLLWLASFTVKSTNSLDSSDFPSHSHSISVQQILNVPCTRLRHLSKHIITLTNLGRFCLCFPWLKQILIAVLSFYIFQVRATRNHGCTRHYNMIEPRNIPSLMFWFLVRLDHQWCYPTPIIQVTVSTWPHVEWTLSQEERTEISVSWLWYLKMLWGS